MDNNTNIFQGVYDIVARIPAGKVISYGKIAALLGNPRFARRVGQAMYGAPAHLNLPCHRVVKVDGSLCHEPFGTEQRERLGEEGVGFLAGSKVDLANYRHYPDNSAF